MQCHDVEAVLVEYVHGELSAAGAGPTAGDVARHLAGCRDCALEYCLLQAVLRGLVDAHHEQPREHVREALRREVAEAFRPAPPTEGASPRRWPRVWTALRRPIPVYSAALLGLVPLLVWGVIEGARLRPAERTGSPPPATISDYDATMVTLAHRDVL